MQVFFWIFQNESFPKTNKIFRQTLGFFFVEFVKLKKKVLELEESLEFFCRLFLGQSGDFRGSEIFFWNINIAKINE